jgi:N-acyl-phosphatidylethanolamine-hydrolysing phospholipase D
VSVAIHHATFPLTTEPLDEPAVRLVAARKAEGLPDSAFLPLRHGALVAVGPGGALLNAPKTMA